MAILVIFNKNTSPMVAPMSLASYVANPFNAFA